MTDSTPRRSRRSSARASVHGGTAEQLHLSVDERPASERLYHAIRQAHDLYERGDVERPRRAAR